MNTASDEVGREMTESAGSERLLPVLAARDDAVRDVAETLVGLPPDWTTWLAERSGAAPELRDRSLAYAGGAPHPDIVMTGDDPDSQARIIE